ncbi:MAG: hypothetical protein COA84_07550 [Robiginitomaculum sp.]|nr:MAG: hypothetical protein COA84_07550 [Robiginitomaculum sp.]
MSAIKAAGQAFGGFRKLQAGRAAKQQFFADAQTTRAEAAVAASIARTRGAKDVGAATARAGASGFGISGSALDVIGQLAADAEFNAQVSIYEGERRATSLRQQGRSAKRRGVDGAIAGGFAAAGTILTAAARAAAAGGGG